MSTLTSADFNLDIIDINYYDSRSELQARRDRELRMYNSRKAAAARQRAAIRRRRMMMLVSGVMLALVIVIMASLFVKAGNDKAEEMSFKYYTEVVVKPGQNLTVIAANYADAEHYDSIQKYIDEVMFINNISNADCIQAGCTLVVPYYSNEYK